MWTMRRANATEIEKARMLNANLCITTVHPVALHAVTFLF